MVSCLSCQKLFSSQKTLNRHNKIVHKQKQHPNSMKYYCSKCTEYFNINSYFRKHLQDMHQFENLTQIMHFENFTDFTEWLAKEECNGGAQYVKVTGTKKSGRNSEKMYFDCIRSHSTIYKPMEGSRKRAVKSQGSCKMSFACPSQIVVTKDLFTTQYSVVYYKSHNHNMEIQHLRIPKLERENIAAKLIVGVPPKEILNSTRENINENLKRVDLLTRKDIRNIKRAYKIDLEDGCYHKDDATSVDISQQTQLCTTDIPAADCKNKWKSLREKYYREKQKLQTTSGSGATNTSTWPHMSYFQFMFDNKQPRETSTNVEVPIIEISETETEDQEELCSPGPSSRESPTACSSLWTTYTVPQTPSRKRTREKNEDPIVNVLQSITNTLTAHNSNSVTDKFTTFARFVESELRDLPSDVADNFIDETLIRLLQVKQQHK